MALASYLQNFSKIGDKNFFEIEIELKKNFDSDLDETQNF